MKKILIIDDDSEFTAAVRTLLEAQGYSILEAVNGIEGYKLARTKSPDCILLDVMMTYDTEGLDTARRFKEDPTTRSIPIILITGISQARKLPSPPTADPDWLPVQAVLEKPVKPQTILDTLTTVLKQP